MSHIIKSEGAAFLPWNPGIHHISITRFIVSLHCAGHWGVKVGKTARVWEGETALHGRGVTGLGLAGAAGTIPFSAGWMAESSQVKKLPEGFAFPTPSAVLGSPCRRFIAPAKMEEVWKSSLAALRQLASVTAEKRELLVFPVPRCVRSGAACQGRGHSTHRFHRELLSSHHGPGAQAKQP